jgi:hypothetical protein
MQVITPTTRDDEPDRPNTREDVNGISPKMPAKLDAAPPPDP